MMDKDIVRLILDKVLEVAARMDGGFSEAMALEIERQIKHEYGGDEVYIPKPLDERKQKALEEARKTGRPAVSASRHGISRSAMYRLLSKGKK